MGLLDRFKGKKKQQDPDQPAPDRVQGPGPEPPPSAEESAAAPPPPSTQPPAQSAPPRDMTDQWIPGEKKKPQAASQGMTGAAGTIRPLTQSEPVAPAQQQPKQAGSEQPATRTVEPVGEDEIDRLLAQAMKGHSTRDIEALWDAILSKRELHILQRGKGEKTEAHAVESPLGPMLLLFTAPFRMQALTATKPYRNSPFVWRAVRMPTEDALEWAIQQHAKGVQAVEFNRSEQPGIASVLQALPARYERVHGRRPKGADLVDPNFEAMANRAKIAGNAAAHAELLEAFFSLQRWYALRDPKRPNQPGFTPIDGKPTLMLFTSETEARLAAEASGRQRELPKVIMPLIPAEIAQWMVKLPEMGAQQAIVNLSSTSFLLPLEGIDRRVAAPS